MDPRMDTRMDARMEEGEDTNNRTWPPLGVRKNPSPARHSVKIVVPDPPEHSKEVPKKYRKYSSHVGFCRSTSELTLEPLPNNALWKRRNKSDPLFFNMIKSDPQ